MTSIEVRVNGTLVGTVGSIVDPASSGAGLSALVSFDILANLTSGTNTIILTGQNGSDVFAGVPDPNYSQNPAAVVFGGTLVANRYPRAVDERMGDAPPRGVPGVLCRAPPSPETARSLTLPGRVVAGSLWGTTSLFPSGDSSNRGEAPFLWPGAALAVVLSVAVTVVMAWPVLRSPRTLIFGHEIVGRHHDPFTAMQQFASGGAASPYRQPLTDEVGAGLARVIGPILAYNVLVLVTFPLTALTTYLLGRYLLGSHRGALVAALAFAFAPVHLAHASYHIHIAQTQWIPLYVLALVAAVDRPTPWRMVLLATSVAGLVLSNDYAGLIGAIITPVALPAFWLARRPTQWRGLWRPATALALVVVAALLIIARAAPDLLDRPSPFAFPAEDLARYGARWWAYFVPPIDHPLLGGFARQVARTANVGPGLLEQQLFLDWSLLALAAGGLAMNLRSRPFTVVQRSMLAVAAVGVWAFVASLAPSSPACPSDSLAPACLVYRLAPMFRAYARLGIVTSLCVALLAGYTVSLLGSRPRCGARAAPAARWLVAGALSVTLIAWWPLPGRARDVLPTEGHRWLSAQAAPIRVLDCTPWTQADGTLPWLMQTDIRLVQMPGFDACDEPGLTGKLAALGFTHVLTRASQPAPWPFVPDGLTPVASFPSARVYGVSAAEPPIVVLGMRGFYNWERSERDKWRWMRRDGTWTVLNTTTSVRTVFLHVELASFAVPRHS